MKVEPIRWACAIPARPSITPSDFCALVKERAATSAPPDDNENSDNEEPDPRAGIALKYTVPEYLEAFRELHVTPRPCKHWLGSKWQRRLADMLIDQRKNPDAAKAQQGTGPDSSGLESKPAVPERPESAKTSAPVRGGMSQSFMDQLKTRRRGELKKAQEKAAEERREQERVARMNAKILEVKRAKLDSLNRQRAAACALAREQLAAKLEATQALSVRLEDVNRELQAVEVHKHNAVTQLKAKRAEQSSSMHLPRSAQSLIDADTMLPAGAPSSNSSTVPKPSAVAAGGPAGAAQAGAAEGVCKQEGQQSQQNWTGPLAPSSNGAEGGAVLPLGVVVTAPTFPPAGGFVVPRLFGSHQDIDLQTPQGDSCTDTAAKAVAQKRMRVDDKPEVAVPNKLPVTSAGGFLPPPQPLASNPLAGMSTLPPAPVTNMGPGPGPSNPPQKVKRPELRPEAPVGMWPGLRGPPGGRFSEEPRPRFQSSDVFGGVRGSSGQDRRPETGSFIGRPAGSHDQAPGFLPRVQPEDGDDLLGSRSIPGLPCSKPGGMMTEALKPLPPVGTSNAADRAGFLDKQPQLLPPPPMHSMHSGDVPPPPAWNRMKKEDKGGE